MVHISHENHIPIAGACTSRQAMGALSPRHETYPSGDKKLHATILDLRFPTSPGWLLVMQVPELACRPKQTPLRREVAPGAQQGFQQEVAPGYRLLPRLSQQTRQLLLTLPC